MTGMNAGTGQALSGIHHLQQSITDILSTPIGSRVMRRDFGSQIARLIDQPGNPTGVMRIIAAVADALRRWETRLQLTRCQLIADQSDVFSAQWTFILEGQLTQDIGDLRMGDSVKLDVPFGVAV